MKKLSNEDIIILKEKFLVSYCKKMGWNHNELSLSQMIAITSKDEYKLPQPINK